MVQQDCNRTKSASRSPRKLRRLNRTITTPLERDLKRAGCPPLESFEVLREIHESGDMQLTSADLQSCFVVPSTACRD